MNSQLKAHLGLLGTNLFFAINYSAIKYFIGHHYAGPFGINIIRISVSVVLFWVLFLFDKPEKKIEKKDIPSFLLCAFTAIALNQMLFIKGLAFTFPIHAALLTLITPILITVMAARILREKITIAKSFGLLLGALGAYIYSQPVFAVIIAMIFLKEELSFHKIIAASLIFAGVYLSNNLSSV